jgi:hypothetical protein
MLKRNSKGERELSEKEQEWRKAALADRGRWRKQELPPIKTDKAAK